MEGNHNYLNGSMYSNIPQPCPLHRSVQNGRHGRLLGYECTIDPVNFQWRH